MEHIEITNPAFLAPDILAFGLDQIDDGWVAQVAWADYETAEIRASSRYHCLELVRRYVA